MHDITTLNVSPLNYGISSPSAAGEETFNVKISFDNQNAVLVTILSCKAITPGGKRIDLPSISTVVPSDSTNVLTAMFYTTWIYP